MVPFSTTPKASLTELGHIATTLVGGCVGISWKAQAIQMSEQQFFRFRLAYVMFRYRPQAIVMQRELARRKLAVLPAHRIRWAEAWDDLDRYTGWACIAVVAPQWEQPEGFVPAPPQREQLGSRLYWERQQLLHDQRRQRAEAERLGRLSELEPPPPDPSYDDGEADIRQLERELYQHWQRNGYPYRSADDYMAMIERRRSRERAEKAAKPGRPTRAASGEPAAPARQQPISYTSAAWQRDLDEVLEQVRLDTQLDRLRSTR